MSMLIACKMCHHEYGAWRPQCTACGHKTPQLETFNAPVERRARTERVAVERRCATTCAFCRVRGAKETCKHCGSLVHRHCLTLHNEAVHRENASA